MFTSRNKFNAVEERLLCLVCVAVVIAVTSLSIAFTNHKQQSPQSAQAKFASEPLEFPAHYYARRPVGLDFNKDMVYESVAGEEIGYARMCAFPFWYRVFHILNTKDEIALVVKKDMTFFTDRYIVEEQWQNATRFYVEYNWSGYGPTKEEYVVRNASGNEVARTDRVRLEFGTIIRVIDERKNSTLGVIRRDAFQLFSTWEIRLQNVTDPFLPRYVFATLAMMTTLREVENEEAMAGD